MPRPKYRVRLRQGELVLGERTLVMGVLNVTPDSFSDQGLYRDAAAAVDRARQMEAEGADIIDLGGESTRPGSERISADEELRRVIPVLQELQGRVTVPISIDTNKPEVARAAIAAGASLINYVAMGPTPAMIEAAKQLGAPLIIMHMRGVPEVMHQLPPWPDPCGQVVADLARLRDSAVQGGVPADHVWLDPGFGFGKNGEENYDLLAGLDRLHSLGSPLVVGTSRKSFIGTTLGAPADQRVWGTAATVTAAILSGVHIVRVHDVAAMVQVARVADQILAHAHHAKMTPGEGT